MSSNKCIVIGCSNNMHLSAILNSMRTTIAPHYTLISASRFSDLIKIAKTMSVNLFIFCFRDNQKALLDYDEMINRSEIPILCIAGRYECETLSWDKNSIVFTCLYEQISQNGYLLARVNSILQLQTVSSSQDKNKSLAESAISSNNKDNFNLSRYVLELDQKINTLQNIKDRIATLYTKVQHPVRVELLSIVHAIKQSIDDKKLWSDFKLLYEKTDPLFLYALAKRHPDLTPVDLKYCCYIKMNMSNDDIRNLLGISQESVRMHKYRLKKKLALDKSDELLTYLRDVSAPGAFN